MFGTDLAYFGRWRKWEGNGGEEDEFWQRQEDVLAVERSWRSVAEGAEGAAFRKSSGGDCAGVTGLSAGTPAHVPVRFQTHSCFLSISIDALPSRLVNVPPVSLFIS